MSVRISVVTVTHNRLETMRRKLDSLLAQTLTPELFEWLVCINGCSDGTLQAFQSLKPPFGLKLKVFDRSQSIGRARNACISQASARLLYLSDDDCLLAPDTLERHLRAQQRAPVAALGAILFEDGERSSLWQPRRVRYWNLNGANSSFPRDAFEAAGGFDEGLEGYGGEDVLLGYRLYRQDLVFRTLPGVPVRHQGPSPMRAGDAAKAMSAGANAVRIARRYPELAFRLGVHPALLPAKRVALKPPLGWLWRALDGASYSYERAYLEGALTQRQTTRSQERR